MNRDTAPTQWQLFGLAVFSGALMIGASVINRLADPVPAVRVVLMLLLVVPLAALAWAITRATQQLDELQLRIHLNAMSVAFVGGIFVAVIYGQLQHARVGVPELNWAFFYPVEVVLWTVGYVLASRRYQ